jgi:hypothetical protein
MEANWRVSAVFAGAAFILSILIGAIAGVGFGLVLLRAIVGAVAFGIVGAVVSLIIARYLPELGSLLGSTPGQSTENKDEIGKTVNIVLPEESNDLNYRPSSMEDGIGEYDSDDGEERSLGGDALVEEVEELASGDEGSEDNELTEADEVSERRRFESAGAEEIVSDRETVELLESGDESLPDIAGLSGSFTEGPESAVPARDGFGAGPTRGNSSSGIDPGDPETIARALRTVLKRDES